MGVFACEGGSLIESARAVTAGQQTVDHQNHAPACTARSHAAGTSRRTCPPRPRRRSRYDIPCKSRSGTRIPSWHRRRARAACARRSSSCPSGYRTCPAQSVPPPRVVRPRYQIVRACDRPRNRGARAGGEQPNAQHARRPAHGVVGACDTLSPSQTCGATDLRVDPVRVDDGVELGEYARLGLRLLRRREAP